MRLHVNQSYATAFHRSAYASKIQFHEEQETCQAS